MNTASLVQCKAPAHSLNCCFLCKVIVLVQNQRRNCGPSFHIRIIHSFFHSTQITLKISEKVVCLTAWFITLWLEPVSTMRNFSELNTLNRWLGTETEWVLPACFPKQKNWLCWGFASILSLSRQCFLHLGTCNRKKWIRVFTGWPWPKILIHTGMMKDFHAKRKQRQFCIWMHLLCIPLYPVTTHHAAGVHK
jgi:hypothetical protein